MLNNSIIRYFNLSYKIKCDEQRMAGVSDRYHNQSYHTRTEMTEAGELRVRAFQIENEICDYLESVDFINIRTKEKRQKKRYFNDYLQRLTPDAREYLYNRYVKGLVITVNEAIERETVEEIHEIEDAIRFMSGEKPDGIIRVEDGTKLEFDELLEVLGV